MRGALGLPALAAALLWVAPLCAQAQTFRLASGLRCVLLEKHDQPLIRAELMTRWNPSEEPAGRKGLPGFLAAVLGAGGAGPYGRPDFNRALDDLGARFAFQARRDAYQWTLVTDSRSQEPAMELLADAVFRPVFDVPLVEAQRQALMKQAEGSPRWDQDPARFLWSLGDAFTLVPPGLEGLGKVGFQELQAFRRRAVRPEASTLVLYGDLSLAQAKELVNLHFGLWGPGAEAPLAPGPEGPPEPRLLADLDTTPDTELWAGCTASGSDAVRALLALLLEQVPAVVSPGVIRACSLEEGRPLLVTVKAGPGGKDGLVEALLATLDGLRTVGFPEQDVARARARWKARVAALPLHPQDLVGRYQALDRDLMAQVDAVGARDLNAALAAMLAPGRLRFLLLGGDAKLQQAAEQAGLGPAQAP